MITAERAVSGDRRLRQADQHRGRDVRAARVGRRAQPLGRDGTAAAEGAAPADDAATTRRRSRSTRTATRRAGSARRRSTRPSPTLSGLGQTGHQLLLPLRHHAPFDAAKLASLYPSHAAFVKAWNAATDKAVKAGFILPADAKNIKAAAAQSTVGGS